MSIMEIVLYNPLIPTGDPVVARTFLPCKTSRTTIISVRRTLSETEIERYGTPKWEYGAAIKHCGNSCAFPAVHGSTSVY